MPFVIYTGDKDKCGTYCYMECPACGKKFESDKGMFSRSYTLGEKLLVCTEHKKELSVEEEVLVQDNLQKALKNKSGRIQKDCKLIKKSDLIERFEKDEQRKTYGL